MALRDVSPAAVTDADEAERRTVFGGDLSSDRVAHDRRHRAPASSGQDELDRLSGPADFTVAEVALRVPGQGSGNAADPWARYRQTRQRVPASLTRDVAG